MKKFNLAALSVAFFIIACSCSNAEKKVVTINTTKDIFTSTEKYQIVAWTVKKSEGYRSYTYRCEAGKSTIGWGVTKSPKFKTIKEADKIFHDRMNPLFNLVKKEYPQLTYMQQGVIVSLIYNTGDISGIRKSNFIKFLVKNDIDKAIDSFLKWNKIKVKKGVYIVSKGLKNRRNYEAKLLANNFTREDYNKLKSEISQIYKENKS